MNGKDLQRLVNSNSHVQATKDEKKLRLIFENAQDMIILVDKHGKILDVNKRVEDLVGYKPAEVMGKNFLKLGVFRRRDVPKIFKLFTDAVVGGKVLRSMELELKHKNGNFIPIESSIRLIKKNNKIEGAISIVRDITDRKKVMEELQEGEAVLSTVFNNTPIIMILVDRERRVRRVNRTTIEFTGRSAEEMMGLRGGEAFRCIYALDDPKGCGFGPSCKTCTVRQTVLDTFDTGNDHNQVVAKLSVTHEGKEIELSLLLSTSLLRIAGTQMTLVCIEDITNLKSAEEKLKDYAKNLERMVEDRTKSLHESEERHRSLAESITDVFFAMDRNLRYTYWNKASEKLTGIPEKDAIGKSIFEIFPDREDTKKAAAMYKKVLRINRPQTFINKFRFGSKDYVFEISAYPTDDGISVFVKDVTKRKEMEWALGERVKELSCLYGITQLVEKHGKDIDAILNGTLTLIPPGWQYPEITCVRIILDDQVFKTENFKEVKWKQSADIKVLGKKIGVIEVCYLEEKPDFDDDPFLKEEKDLINAISERLGRVIENTQVKETLRKAEQEKEIMKMKDQFISIVTHELRTPLISIKGYVDHVLSGKLGQLSQEVSSSLEVAKRNTDRLLSLVNDLLDIQRLKSGRFELNLEPIDFREVINDCAKEIQPYTKKENQNFLMELPDSPLMIQGDRIRLSQAIMNLLSNASKFTPEGGKIILRVNAEKGVFKVQVSDTGIGIKKDDLERIFEPFVAIHKPRHIKGTGLGLSVTKGLVEGHGGQIWIESAGEGKGSTFIFTLPELKKKR